MRVSPHPASARARSLKPLPDGLGVVASRRAQGETRHPRPGLLWPRLPAARPGYLESAGPRQGASPSTCPSPGRRDRAAPPGQPGWRPDRSHRIGVKRESADARLPLASLAGLGERKALLWPFLSRAGARNPGIRGEERGRALEHLSATAARRAHTSCRGLNSLVLECPWLVSPERKNALVPWGRYTPPIPQRRGRGQLGEILDS